MTYNNKWENEISLFCQTTGERNFFSLEKRKLTQNPLLLQNAINLDGLLNFIMVEHTGSEGKRRQQVLALFF